MNMLPDNIKSIAVKGNGTIVRVGNTWSYPNAPSELYTSPSDLEYQRPIEFVLANELWAVMDHPAITVLERTRMTTPIKLAIDLDKMND